MKGSVSEIIAVVVVSILIVSSLTGQESNSSTRKDKSDETIELQWKVTEGNPIKYETVFRNVMSGNIQMELDPQTLLEWITEKPKEKAFKKIEIALKNISFPSSTNATTIFHRVSDGRIGLKLILETVEFPDTENKSKENKEWHEFLKSLEGSVQLRGLLDRKGTIKSFWKQQRQKNLLALMAQLPKSPVAVGDTWQLDANLVNMGHSFICESSKRVNRVRLKDIKNKDGDRIAVLEYTINEYVEGKLKLPRRNQKDNTSKEKKMSAGMGFMGHAEFNATRGHWESFNGILTKKYTGMMNQKSQQRIAMRRKDK